MSANPQLVRAAELHPACQDTTRHIADIGLALNQSMREHTVVLQLPGVQICAAPDLLAEIGPGAVAFPSAAQFASWVGVCPGQQESASVSYSNALAQGESLFAPAAMPARLDGPVQRRNVFLPVCSQS